MMRFKFQTPRKEFKWLRWMIELIKEDENIWFVNILNIYSFHLFNQNRNMNTLFYVYIWDQKFSEQRVQ